MIVDVAIPLRVAGSFHYEAPPEIAPDIQVGSVIEVPFRNQTTFGYVIGLPGTTTLDPSRIKKVSGLMAPAPLFDGTMLTFLKWVSEYYCHPLGEVISAAIPKQSWEPRTTKPLKKTKDIPSMDILAGAIPEKLTEEQSAAIKTIIDPEDKRPLLLHGVTGSGKTEVYIQCLKHWVEEGKGAIVLVPEISLTPLLLSRFSQRFPGIIAVWHSHLTPRERRDEWERVQRGEARIVVGARSAVFAPIKNLGCIVIDEEHETSFKQEDELRYHARDMAIVRASQVKAKVIMGSATPSAESFFHSSSGKFAYTRLTTRVQERPMPSIEIVDLKREDQKIPGISWLSQKLDHAIQIALEKKEQTLLYLNRLGFSHLLYCDDCGHSWRCLNCDVGLTYYSNPRTLRCHYCGLRLPAPSNCPQCKGVKILPFGFGTEQIEKKLQEKYPQARIARMDRSAVKTKKELENLIERIARKDIDIVIGTQMIAKGHDFPGITLVGILAADAHLALPDFRAHERTFQMLTQVSGRSGRAENKGNVIIQTFQPQHPIIQMILQPDQLEFYQGELASRRTHRFPPFSRLALVRFQHKNTLRVGDFAQKSVRYLLGEFTRHQIQCSILGPSEAPIARIKNYYRWHCLIKSGTAAELRRAITTLQDFVLKQKSGVQVYFDVDPINSM